MKKHHEYLHAHRDPKRESERRVHEFVEVLTSELEERAERGLRNGADGASGVMREVREGGLNPYSAARRIIEDGAAIAELLTQGGAKPGQR